MTVKDCISWRILTKARLAVKSGSKAAYILASHPHPEDRISALKKMIGEKGYRVAPGVPFPGLKGDGR